MTRLISVSLLLPVEWSSRRYGDVLQVFKRRKVGSLRVGPRQHTENMGRTIRGANLLNFRWVMTFKETRKVSIIFINENKNIV